jgi:transcriptional regulator with XRE-family HTH domain
MTQEELRQAAGVSLKTVFNLEAGEVLPQRGTLMRIRDALGLPEDLNEAISVVEGYEAPAEVVMEAERPPVTPAGNRDYLRELEVRVIELERKVAALDARLSHAAGVILATLPEAEVLNVSDEPTPSELPGRAQLG